MHSDHQLWQRWCEGDRDALETLWERHQPVLLADAAKFTITPALAPEDLVQGFFVYISPKLLTHYQPTGSLRAWLRRAFHYYVLGKLRKKSGGQTSAGQLTDTLAAADPTPQQAAEETELHTELWRCIDALDAGLRKALIARFFEAKGVVEVAEALKLSIGSISRRVKTAVEKLRLCLQSKGFVSHD